MNKTCHSEYGKIKSVFIKKASAAFVNDENINTQWKALNYLGKVESKIKTNSTINSLSMIKNSITNICATSWSYF